MKERIQRVKYVCPMCGKVLFLTSAALKARTYCSVSCLGRSKRKYPHDDTANAQHQRDWTRTYFQIYTQAHREHLNAQSREWVVRNRDSRIQIQARYRTRNKAKIKALSLIRRAGKKRGVKASTVQTILLSTGGRCVYCGKPAKLTIDHFTPLVAGGTNKRSNLLPCCRSCNSSKNAKDAPDWIFEKFGKAGLGRALLFVERKPIPEALWLA